MTCKGCQRPMRPFRTALADYPGTVLHRARGICCACYRRGDVTTSDPHRATLEENRQSLAAYLRRRAPFRTAKDMTWQ